MESREQRIVRVLAGELGEGKDWAALRSAAQSMPALVLQHGPTQLFVFYRSKDKAATERKLLEIFAKAMEKVNPGSPFADANVAIDVLFRRVADRPLVLRLRDHAIANEVATWIARSIDARWREQKAQTPEQEG